MGAERACLYRDVKCVGIHMCEGAVNEYMRPALVSKELYMVVFEACSYQELEYSD